MKVYKVRDPKTGLFQKGGSGVYGTGKWSKNGKTWSTLAHLKSHFTTMREYSGRGYRDNSRQGKDPIDPTWEIVVLTLVETEDDIKTVGDLFK